MTVHGHRLVLSIRTQSDLICAPRLLIAEQPPTVQIEASAAAGINGDAPLSPATQGENFASTVSATQIQVDYALLVTRVFVTTERYITDSSGSA